MNGVEDPVCINMFVRLTCQCGFIIFRKFKTEGICGFIFQRFEMIFLHSELHCCVGLFHPYRGGGGVNVSTAIVVRNNSKQIFIAKKCF